jgi:prepilin-type N-terminal cleavage/methylation domain-containing protein
MGDLLERKDAMKRDGTRRGFSLLEVIITIGLIGILVAVAAAAVVQSRERGRQLVCAVNLRHISEALRMHYHDHKCFPDGLLPAALAAYGLPAKTFRCPNHDADDSYSRFYVKRVSDKTGEFVIGCPRHGSGGLATNLTGLSKVSTGVLAAVTAGGQGVAPGDTLTSGTMAFGDGSTAQIGDGLTVSLVQSFRQKDGVLYSLVRIEQGSCGDLRCTVTPGSRFEVLTPAGVAAVEGTEFVVRVGEQDGLCTMTVDVTKGRVRVDPYQEQFASRLLPGMSRTVIGPAFEGDASGDPVSEPDEVAPQLAITQPAEGGIYATGDNSIAVSGSASDNVGVAGVAYRLNDSTESPCSGTTGWFTGNLNLRLGLNTFTIRAFDAAGNATTKTLIVKRLQHDTAPPVVSIMVPADNGSYATAESVVTLGGGATDDVGVTQVAWSNDRGGSGVCTGTGVWGAADVALYTGTNTITVTARDAAGNEGTAALTVTWEPRPPIEITVPTSMATWETNRFVLDVAGTASAGIEPLSWSNNRGGSGVLEGTDNWSVRIPLYEGENVITGTARDASGNEFSGTLRVTRIGAPPVGLEVLTYGGVPFLQEVREKDGGKIEARYFAEWTYADGEYQYGDPAGNELWDAQGSRITDAFTPND